MTLRSLTHRAPLLGLVIAWSLGSGLAHTGAWPLTAPAGALLALLGLGLAWLAPLGEARHPRLAPAAWAAGLLLALAAAGAVRTEQTRARLPEWDALSLPPREARLEFEVERTFATRDPGQISGLARVHATAPHLRDLEGQRIQFSITWTDPEGGPPRGARLVALGVLAPLPFAPPRAGFEAYLANEAANFTFTRARLLEPPGAAGAWHTLCARAADRLERLLRSGLENRPELADIYVAMLLGKKAALSVEQKDWFVRSGTMHLFAVSGLHIAAIGVALNTLLALLRLPVWPRLALGTALLWFYVQITGGEASALRAFWMVTCLLAARQCRAPGNSLSALALSALGVLVVAPHQLFGAGFQMSYGIVAALLLYGVPLQEKWSAAWQPWSNLPAEALRWPHHLLDAGVRFALGLLALSLAATLVSTPATLAFFHLVTPGGFFVNLLLIPASSLALFAGLAAWITGLAGLSPLVVFFNHAGALVLFAMEATVELSLGVPGTSAPARFEPPALAPAALLGMLALLALGYATRWPKRAGGYVAPWVALGLLLVLGVRLGAPIP
jgi:competence protein ComEC